MIEIKTHGKCVFSTAINTFVCQCKFGHIKIPAEYGCSRYLEGKTYEEKLASLDKKVFKNTTETKRKSKKHSNSEHTIPDYFKSQ